MKTLARMKLKSFIQNFDSLIGRMYMSVARERPAVLGLMFHVLLEDDRELKKGLISPHHPTTLEQFKNTVAYYQAADFQFLRPEDLRSDLDPSKNHAILSFDDGYANNLRALPVLREFDVPAIFYISTDHVLEGKVFWWDALYRERNAEGAPWPRIRRETLALKSWTTEAIEAHLKKRWGDRVLDPRGEVDRPMTPSELAEFARDPRVILGNHTSNHAILTNYPEEAARKQLSHAQEAIQAVIGAIPRSIAYPNGFRDAEVIRLCEEVGLDTAATCEPSKNYLPLSKRPGGLIEFGRFALNPNIPVDTQCLAFRADISLLHLAHRLRSLVKKNRV